MKATAIAHPIQGLIKYHGLKDARLRIPFHDSISVCVGALQTTTTVETTESLKEDLVIINGKKAVGTDLERVEVVLNKLRRMTLDSGHFKVVSQNSITSGKGLGFSASGFAALGTAASTAVGSDVDYISLSELVRLGAGSATRSLAGSFAILYADKNGKSYAEQLVKPEAVNLGMVIIPIPSSIRTDEAHSEVLSSPLFKARLKYVAKIIKTMEEAIKTGDIATIGRLAEEDSLNLHASTMTGKAHMILWEPETVRIVREVQRMQREGIPVWYSIDTGPSVFVNTFTDYLETVADRLRESGFSDIMTSKVGGSPFLSGKHLF
ncbi:MAG: diphosphomevalonate decarboxylase [Candidatus Bathyarchaeota archaeon]|nr:diphosphomevalonate decarboxylase [Candidatus Bathyarchaeota archaeon]MDH5746208.1 diphosphomevalonate decarboxylase [Candidatus Bathyarchaeota archaeon]